jgi:hypothetical protein
MTTSYFVARHGVPTIGSGTAIWREKLFANASQCQLAADFPNLPNKRRGGVGQQDRIGCPRRTGQIARR